MPFLGNITPKEVFEMGLHARPCHQRDSRRCNRNLLRAPEVDLVISYYCQQESQVPRHDSGDHGPPEENCLSPLIFWPLFEKMLNKTGICISVGWMSNQMRQTDTPISQTPIRLRSGVKFIRHSVFRCVRGAWVH